MLHTIFEKKKLFKKNDLNIISNYIHYYFIYNKMGLPKLLLKKTFPIKIMSSLDFFFLL